MAANTRFPAPKNFFFHPKNIFILSKRIEKSFCFVPNPAPSLFSSSSIAPKKEGLLRKENFKHWLDKKSDT